MTLTAHRPARRVASLLGEDPAELAADLPRLPHGATLDPRVLQRAACGHHDPDLFYPEPGDTHARARRGHRHRPRPDQAGRDGQHARPPVHRRQRHRGRL